MLNWLQDKKKTKKPKASNQLPAKIQPFENPPLQQLLTNPNRNELLEQIRVLVRDNPELTAQLIQSWVKEPEDKR